MNWISVKTELPKKPGDVIVVCTDGTFFMAQRMMGHWHLYFSDVGLQPVHNSHKVTHWANLPEPPKQ